MGLVIESDESTQLEPAGEDADSMSSSAVDSTASSCEEDEDTEPSIEVRWSKSSVTPDHNSSWPPASAPTDTIPEEAKVSPLVETTDVPDGSAVTIDIYSCASGSVIPDGNLTGLVIQGNRAVDPATGEPPEWVFNADHLPWEAWDCPYFYFAAQVDYRGLAAETPSDYAASADECLRVRYWHYCVAETGSLSGVLPECNTVAGLLNGVPHSRATVKSFGSPDAVSVPQYGSLVRNTYVFHNASHGNATHRTTGAFISAVTSSMPPDDVPNPGDYRSVIHITPGPLRFGDNEINTTASLPSVPRYLFYSNTCLTGWESSFADALTGRGCRNVIAFRVSIPDGEAVQMATDFYTRWANDYQLDPEHIPDCFFEAGADHYDNMRPILYGAGGGEIQGGGGLSAGEIALIAVAAVAVGVVIGVGLWALLK